MKNIAIVYWSGTGNTETMANAVAEGAQQAEAQVTLFPAVAFNAELMAGFDAVGFGCPAMGSEELEEMEFAPMFEGLAADLKDKPIALFGSYSWAEGEWMRTWAEQCRDLGARLVADPFPCYDAPDDQALETCRELGGSLAQA